MPNLGGKEEEFGSQNVSSDVIAYRLGNVEARQDALDTRFNEVRSSYPSKEIVDLLLQPLKNSLADLGSKFSNIENALRQAEVSKDQQRNQMKLLILSAILSPVIAVVVSVIIIGRLGGIN